MQEFPRRLTVFYQDSPFPTNRGDRADVGRRLMAFRKLGVEVQLVHWVHTPGGVLDASTSSELDSVVRNRIAYPVRRRLKTLPPWDLLRVPFHVTKYRLDRTELSALVGNVRAFGPDAVWQEGPWTSEAGRAVAKALAVPLYYRSHNIEHRYMPSQAMACADRKSRWSILLSNLHMEGFERRLVKSASRVFDISSDDMQWWRTQGVSNNSWLPPLAEAAFRQASTASRDIDVLFHGNLSTPNNLSGLHWMLDNVWPQVRVALPDARLVVAGSNPKSEVADKIRQSAGAELIPNPDDMLALVARARVHANPVMTGSGVQLKTVEMLASGAPVVTTTQGLAGLPRDIFDAVQPCDDARAFADQILKWLRESTAPMTTTEIAEAFSLDGFSKRMLVDRVNSSAENGVQ